MQKYSALMAVYVKDNPEYFALALDSMIKQTVPPDEIVIVKDGPITEELQAVIDKRKGETRINEVSLDKNQGVGVARNEGLNVCRNALVAVMDSDDYSLPQRCEVQLKAFADNPKLDIIGSPVKEFLGTTDNIVSERFVPSSNEEIYQYARKRDPFNHPTVMYKRDTIKRCGGYKNYRRNIDTDLWIRLLLNGAVCMNTKEALVYFRFDEGAYRRRKSWDNTRTFVQVKYNAWKRGFNTLGEFLFLAMAQIGIFLMPEWFQRVIYKNFLRQSPQEFI